MIVIELHRSMKRQQLQWKLGAKVWLNEHLQYVEGLLDLV